MRMNLLGVIGELDSLPGCSQVAVSHGVFVLGERHKGKGTAANKKRQELAFDQLGYDLMICTVTASNTTQIRVLIKSGWYFLTSFHSRKTKNKVEVWACNRPDFGGRL